MDGVPFAIGVLGENVHKRDMSIIHYENPSKVQICLLPVTI